MTKQAAQKRFVPRAPDLTSDVDAIGRFGRFTPRARHVVVAAQEAAREAGNAEIGPPHVVLGLLAEPESVAIVVCQAQGVTPDDLRAAAQAALPEGDGELRAGHLAFSGEAKKALELTFRQALRLGHNFIGTEHILLALLELEDGDGPLHRTGLRGPAVEASIVEVLSALSARPAGSEPVDEGGRADS